jgi:hypothetical protein
MAVPITPMSTPWAMKNVSHLRFARAHRHEHGDVFGFFHDHHDQRNQNVQRGDEDDETDGDEGDQALQTQGVEQELGSAPSSWWS